MPAILIPGETVTLNQDGSLTVQQRYTLSQSEVANFSPSQPSGFGGGAFSLESVSATNLEAGLAEATATWRKANEVAQTGSGGNLYNITVEIVASTNEEPISVHKGSGNFDFSTMTAQEVKNARDAADGYDTDGQIVGSTTAVNDLPDAKSKNLARYYQKGIEYFRSPSVTVRLSGRTNNVNTSNVGKAYSANALPVPSDMKPTLPTKAGATYEWLLVSITSRSVPASNARSTAYFEVTEEYLLSGPAGWDGNLYPSGTGTIIDPA